MQGTYPVLRGNTNWGGLFTRQRALTFHDDEALAWARFSGLQLTSPRGSFDRAFLHLGPGSGAYSRLFAGDGTKFWVDALCVRAAMGRTVGHALPCALTQQRVGAEDHPCGEVEQVRA